MLQGDQQNSQRRFPIEGHPLNVPGLQFCDTALAHAIIYNKSKFTTVVQSLYPKAVLYNVRDRQGIENRILKVLHAFNKIKNPRTVRWMLSTGVGIS